MSNESDGQHNIAEILANDSVILNTNSIPSTANTKKNLFRKNQVKKLGESGKSLFLCFPHGGIDKLST